MHGQDPAHLATGDAHLMRLLHQRHVAVIEIDGVHHAGLFRQPHQLARLGEVHRQRLFGDDVLAGREDVLGDREVEMIRRAIVHDLNLRIGQAVAVVAVRFRYRERRRLRLGQLLPPLRHRDDFDIPQPPQRLDVRRADETCADDACFDFGHGCIYSTISTSTHRPSQADRLDRVEHRHALRTVAEVGHDRRLLVDRAHQLVHRVDERVLVADDVPRRPPGAEERMHALGGEDLAGSPAGPTDPTCCSTPARSCPRS